MVKTGQSLTFQFPSVGSTGALTNADSTPTCTMYVDGVADGGAVTVTNPATGRYKAVCTVPTLTAGQCFEVWAAFAVATVNGGGIVFRDMADTTYPSETYARIGAPAGASIAADLAAIEAQTDDIGVAGAGLTALGDARLANLDAAVSTRATPAQVNTEADTALSDVGLTTTITGRIDAAISSRLASAGYTTPPTVGAIADQVWDEALAGHLTAGTTGKALSDAGAAGDPWSTDLDAGGYAAGTAGDILLDLQGGTVYAIGSTPNTTADLYIRRGDTVAVTIGDLTGLAAGWDVLWVTIKRSEHDADSAAILQVRLNVATPTLPGLIYINGQTPTDAGVAATDAWISDVDAGADTLVLNIKPAASLLLPARGSLWFDVQQLDGTTVTSLATGEKTCEIGADITRATS